MHKEHPVFVSPDNPDATIWRYMDCIKFVSLLEREALFFSRVDKLGDPFEGSCSRKNVELRPELYKDMPQEARQKLSEIYSYLRKHTFVSCWHINEYETAALWSLYLKSEDGIAIQSSYQRLCESLREENEQIYIGKVQYIDFDKEWMPENNTLYPFVHKQKSYKYEEELRAVIQKLPYEGENLKLNKKPVVNGLYIKTDIDTLIRSVYVAPHQPDWKFELVKSIAKKYGLSRDIRHSDLSKDPVY